MSDLISRSEVNNVIDELEVYTCGRPNTMKVEISVLQLQRLINKLKNIPTAYDIDKVVEELEEMKTIKGSMKTVTCRKWDYGTVNRAIEIVKQGGVSDDVCEWESDCHLENDNPAEWLISPHKPKKIFSTDIKYCPYCWKNIKVVE